ncbi:hypothetical protein C0J52_16403, partial [Blattella germanica]
DQNKQQKASLPTCFLLFAHEWTVIPANEGETKAPLCFPLSAKDLQNDTVSCTMTPQVLKLTQLLLCMPLIYSSSMVAPSYSKVALIDPQSPPCRGEVGCSSHTTRNLGLHRHNTGSQLGKRRGFTRTVPSRREENGHVYSNFYRQPTFLPQRRYHPSEVGYRPNRPKALDTPGPMTDIAGMDKPQSNGKPGNGDTEDSPTDFYDYDFTDHKSAAPSSAQAHGEAYKDDYEHNHDHMYMDQHPEEENRNKKPYSYYYIGRKLWYIPLYFSVYFIVYVSALLLKSIARHKIVYPLIHWNSKEKRSIEDITQEVIKGLENAYFQYS